MLVVVVLVLAMAMLAVYVVDVLRVDKRLMPTGWSVDVHMPSVRFVDLVRTVGAVLDEPAGTVMEMPVVEEVPVILVADFGMATKLVVEVRVIGGAIRSCCHGLIICLPAWRSQHGMRVAA